MLEKCDDLIQCERVLAAQLEGTDFLGTWSESPFLRKPKPTTFTKSGIILGI